MALVDSDLDYALALSLQHGYNHEDTAKAIHDKDAALALALHREYNETETDADFALSLAFENTDEDVAKDIQEKQNILSMQKHYSNHSIGEKSRSIVDKSWEFVDPNPKIHDLFLEFNHAYFYGKLNMVEVRWSPRMTLCAGVCSYEGGGGLCSVRLSQPLLKFRPRKDLVQTLLHEMIHAYLFVTANNRDHDSHGPEFHKHMWRINAVAGTNITVYHSFHDEVDMMRQHWWRCDGVCRNRKPFFGYVKRSMNRAPSANDRWWKEHQMTCGGVFHKIKEPENYKKPKKDASNAKKEPLNKDPGKFKSTATKRPHSSNNSETILKHFKPSSWSRGRVEDLETLGEGRTLDRRGKDPDSSVDSAFPHTPNSSNRKEDMREWMRRRTFVNSAKKTCIIFSSDDGFSDSDDAESPASSSGLSSNSQGHHKEKSKEKSTHPKNSLFDQEIRTNTESRDDVQAKQRRSNNDQSSARKSTSPRSEVPQYVNIKTESGRLSPSKNSHGGSGNQKSPSQKKNSFPLITPSTHESCAKTEPHEVQTGVTPWLQNEQSMLQHTVLKTESVKTEPRSNEATSSPGAIILKPTCIKTDPLKNTSMKTGSLKKQIPIRFRPNFPSAGSSLSRSIPFFHKPDNESDTGSDSDVDDNLLLSSVLL